MGRHGWDGSGTRKRGTHTHKAALLRLLDHLCQMVVRWRRENGRHISCRVSQHAGGCEGAGSPSPCLEQRAEVGPACLGCSQDPFPEVCVF